MPSKITPYDPSEELELAEVAKVPSRCFTVRVEQQTKPLLIWASNERQAGAIARSKMLTVKGIKPNYHAQNMTPRPNSWTQFILQGGGE